jgi:tRNA pseudouridine38-40 synthase
VNFKLTIAYDGTDFVGWQRQASGASIQSVLEEALSDLDGRAISIAAAGRTDAGVHARGQVVSAALERVTDVGAILRATNIRLPPTIRVLSVEEAPPEFHARFDARAKRYRYRIWNAEVLPPFERLYVWHLPPPGLDVEAMRDAAARLEGRHDFAAFQGTGADTHTTIRTITVSRIDAPGRPLLTYDVAGDGFLRHMVRNIVGTLVDVGRGRRDASWVGEVLRSRDRATAGQTAPAAGLFLMDVSYERSLTVQSTFTSEGPHVA